jgi:hypothetical protein
MKPSGVSRSSTVQILVDPKTLTKETRSHAQLSGFGVRLHSEPVESSAERSGSLTCICHCEEPLGDEAILWLRRLLRPCGARNDK